jgi:hypothetical protein
MTEDNDQDRTPSEGQGGIDRETEDRNRENEAGQAKDQQFGQDKTDQSGQSPSDKDRGSSAFGQQGQSAGGDTSLSERTGQTGGGESSTGEASSQGFVGTGNDNSSDYVTKSEQDQDFAPEGQGAQDTSAGRSDVETGQSADRDDDGSIGK